METLESSRVCRLCGQHSGICINIFDKNENHYKKINAVLPILVHEMDLLPKQMCHRCSYKLEEFHKFYSDCLKTDMDLKSQLSWMRKREVKEQIRVPMVQIENVKIKSEPPDYDIYELDPIVENVNYINSMSSMTFSMNNLRNNNDVDSSIINHVDKRFSCDTRLTDCTHCKCNYGERDSTHEAALSINHTNNRSKHGVKLDSNCTQLSSFQNSPANVLRKTKQQSSKKVRELNVSNILGNNEVQKIIIKTETPDDFGTRSLRPRKKSIDYIGTKKKKSNLIINPANIINKSLEAKTKITTTKQFEDQIVNRIFIEQIKREPMEDIQRRVLRPRKFLIDYLGSKRKELPRAKSDVENQSSNEVVRSKRCKSSSGFKESKVLSIGSGKGFTGLITDPTRVKVKEEIISDNEATNVGENNEPTLVGGNGSCVQNLSNLFGRETMLAVKVEKNIEKEFLNLGSKTNEESKSLKKLNMIKSKLRKGGSKRISDTNCSPKYLRSQNLRLRNGKVKKSESEQQLSPKGWKKRFLELAEKGRVLGNNLEKKIRENENIVRVPKLLKTANNIKHFCEKCCTSFMNKELYMLHYNTCYFD